MPKSGTAASSCRAIFNILRNLQIDFQSGHTTWIFYLNHSDGCKVESQGTFWSTFPLWLKALYFLKSTCQSLVIPLLRILFYSVSHFFKMWLFKWGLQYFIYLRWWHTVRCRAGEDLLPILLDAVFPIYRIFALQKLFSFKRSNLSIVDLIAWAIVVLFRKLCPVPMSWTLFPTYCSLRLSKSSIILRSLMPLELNFVHGDRYGSICILLNAET